MTCRKCGQTCHNKKTCTIIDQPVKVSNDTNMTIDPSQKVHTVRKRKLFVSNYINLVLLFMLYINIVALFTLNINIFL